MHVLGKTECPPELLPENSKSFILNYFIIKTRTAWAVFKYCGTKTATLSLSIRS
jgi:hypothetical protein